MVSRIMFYLNRSKERILETVQTCTALCQTYGIVPLYFRDDVAFLEQCMHIDPANVFDSPKQAKADMLFVFGGDGTMLRAIDSFVAYDIPVLGVNLGRLGFLLETEIEDIPQAFQWICEGKYEIERRMMLHVQMLHNGKSVSAYATNEVSISRGLSQRMIALDAYVGKTHVDHYIADGIVLASPTGSTGYSLSAGGPIVSPDVPCFVLNPICPHTIQSRPIVLSCNEVVTLSVSMKEMREGIQLSIDGQAICQMQNHEQIQVSRSDHDTLLVRFPKERNYFSLLKDKLSQWSL